jgi:hypothetical protein
MAGAVFQSLAKLRVQMYATDCGNPNFFQTFIILRFFNIKKI